MFRKSWLLLLLASSSLAQTGNVRLIGGATHSPIAGVNTSGSLQIYVSQAGSDTNDGRSPAHAIKSIGKLDQLLKNFVPGDGAYLRRGDTFSDDYIRLVNTFAATTSSTLTSNPALPSGVPAQPIVISAYGNGANPILEAADPINCTWTATPGYANVWQCTIATQLPPDKLFIDPLASGASVPLTPVPNFVGTCDSTGATIYNFLDSCPQTVGVSNYTMGSVTGPGTGSNFVTAGNSNSQVWATHWATGFVDFAQHFPLANTGLQNVAAIGGGSGDVGLEAVGTGYPASTTMTISSSGGGPSCVVAGTAATSSTGSITGLTITSNGPCTSVPTLSLSGTTSSTTVAILTYRPDPGSWYVSGAPGAYTLYVHTADNSSPNAHTFKGTFRNYGVDILGVNGVKVSEIQCGHQGKACVADYAYQTSGSSYSYNTGEYLTIANVNAWNVGDLTTDTQQFQAGLTSGLGGCFIAAGNATHAKTTTHLIRGISITKSTCNRVDQWFGEKYNGTGGIAVKDTDQVDLEQNYIASVNAEGIFVGNSAFQFLTAPAWFTNLGTIAYNELTANANGNLMIGGAAGPSLHHNYIHESFGEGIQWGVINGGNMQTPSATWNIIANLGPTPGTLAGYNGSDCNGGTAGLTMAHNTIYNVYGSDTTFEGATPLTNHTAQTDDCPSSTKHDDLEMQAAYFWVGPYSKTQAPNISTNVYFTDPSNTSDKKWNNNIYLPSPNVDVNKMFSDFHSGLYYGCSSLANFPDTNSSCQTTPGLTNASGSYTQQADFAPSSTTVPVCASGAASDGTCVGALIFGQTSIFPAGMQIGANPNDVP